MGIKRSVTGMALDIGTIVVVQARRSGPGWLLKRYAGVDIPEAAGGEKPRFAVSIEGFKSSAVDALEASGIRSGNVSLSIPDIFAKTAILEFEELPAKALEADEVVRWKIARTWYMRPEEITVDYQVLSKEPTVKVLTVAVKRDLVKGYEDALAELGLSTTNVNIHSLNLLRLLRGSVGEAGNFSLIMRMKGYFSVSIFNGGVMDFYRCKSLHGSTEQFVGELGASFAFYSGGHPGVGLERSYLFNGDESFTDALETITKKEVVVVRPEDMLKPGGAETGFDGIDTTTLLAAIGAVAAQ